MQVEERVPSCPQKVTQQVITPDPHSSKSKNIYKEKKSFASGINFYKLMWIFVIGCVIGVIIETIWTLAGTGKIESRKGLIYGPFSPVYGFGAVLFTILLYRLRKHNSIVIFTLCALIGALFEYFCSWFQETALGTLSWEYSDSPLNLNGRTNLMYAICWGFLGLLYIKHIYPFCSRMIEKIPNKIGKWITWFLFFFMVFDIFISASAIKRATDRNYDIPATNQFAVFLDKHYPDEFLQKVYPNMEIV